MKIRWISDCGARTRHGGRDSFGAPVLTDFGNENGSIKARRAALLSENIWRWTIFELSIDGCVNHQMEKAVMGLRVMADDLFQSARGLA